MDDEYEKALQSITNPELRQSLLRLRASMQKHKAESNQETQETPPQAPLPVQFPVWPELQRGSPNAFLRSAVFSAIQGKERRYMQNELIVSQKGYEIRFTGMKLDQSDFDVWLQAAHIARNSPLGDVCVITAWSFLKSIGRSQGKSDYEWLKNSLRRLQTSMIEIKNGDEWIGINLLIRTKGNNNTKLLNIQFDPLLVKLFASDNWTSLQWDIRNKLKGKPLALWLHGFYTTHKNPYPIKVETLMAMCGSESRDKWGFKRKLKKALDLLQEVAGFETNIKEDLVFVIIPSFLKKNNGIRDRK